MSNHAVGHTMGNFLYFISKFYQSKEISENAFRKISEEAKDWVIHSDGNINEMLEYFGSNNFCFLCFGEYGKVDYKKENPYEIRHIDAFIDNLADVIGEEKNLPQNERWKLCDEYGKFFENHRIKPVLPLVCKNCFEKYYAEDFANASKLTKEKIVKIFNDTDNYPYLC